MKKVLFIVWLLCCMSLSKTYAQYTDGVTGLLHMPNAEMQKDGTVMLGGNFLNKHNLPSDRMWGYNTYNYFLNITFFGRIEVAYICTLLQGKPEFGERWPEYTYGKFTNQDRHFAGRINVIKEGELWKHMPSIVLGVNDPTTDGGGDYTDFNVNTSGNGYFNRWYIAATKHIQTQAGELGIHATYLYNKRLDYKLNGPAVGINFRPTCHPTLNLIAEYDAKTFNIGATYSVWNDHFQAVFELQQCKYISAGLIYKVNLLGGNNWKSKLFQHVN